MSSCFISDLHLDNKRKDVKKSFFNFLESEASEFDNLYILGDLFEVWIGDDFSDQLANEVVSNLKKYSNKNKKIFIMHGNRDFLLGKEFGLDWLYIAIGVAVLQIISPFTKFCPVYTILNKIMPQTTPMQNGK